MDNKVKTAFEQIHADCSLKEKTKKEVYRRMEKRAKMPHTGIHRVAAAVACVLAVIIGVGGYFSYTLPVAAVSIDVNPSVELQVNIFGRVIDVEGYNDDGTILAEELSVDHLNYADAVNAILDSQEIQSCMAADGFLEITVVSGGQKKAEKMRNCISDKTGIEIENIYCLKDQDEVETAHSAGLSFGKYRAYLELHEINPDITIEDVQGLTMREIREMIQEQTADVSETEGCEKDLENSQEKGQEHGNGHRYGKN